MAIKLFQALTRKKSDDDAEGNKDKLARVLTLVDLTALGVGSTLGIGAYVLAGSTAKTIAGPAVCISFLVAAIASAVAGLCYAEFASRVPKAGSAYVYSYVSVGEFVAFVIGWNLILEYVIGTASVARGLTNYIDALAGNVLNETFTRVMPMHVSNISSYPDFVSLGFVLLLTVLLAIGVKESTTFNNVFTVLNLVTVCIVIIAGAIKADPTNWRISKVKAKSHNGGEGGFLPYGAEGIMAGAAKCFYGFVGFDAVATTGEEAKNPQRDIPLAIVASLIVIFLAYFGISTVLTMDLPYYDLDPNAPLPDVFDKVGWPAIKWIVTVGAIFALCTSLLGAMFPLPRILYAMSKDGIIFRFLASVHPRLKTPLIATIVSGVFAGIMACLFDLDQLINMMSIGTLLAYTIVAICVLILRYKPPEGKAYPAHLELNSQEFDIFGIFKDLFNLNMNKYPTEYTSRITNWSIVIFSVFSIGFGAVLVHGFEYIQPSEPSCFIPFIILLTAMIVVLIVIARQPIEDAKIAFKVPCVPLIPCLSIVINFYLMLELDSETWIRFAVWLGVGFLVYFCYGILQSNERIKGKELELEGKKIANKTLPEKISNL